MNTHLSARTLDVVRAFTLPHKFCALLCISLAFFTYAIQPRAEIPSTSFYSNFGDLAFKDQHSQPFKIANLNHKITLFNFIYTQCSAVCPVQTKALAEILEGLPNNIKSRVVFVSVSLDPWNDTPTKLKAFAHRMHAEANNWAFITGNPADIVTVTERLKLFGTDPKKLKQVVRPDDHTTHLWLVDAQGRLMMRYIGNPIDKARIAQDIAQLNTM
ncbi:SCO family protein [Methylotenera sp. N17]|uniref:SCO family protein n=1 Tax=Methylotenera sp. N17 TaxID=1502761 RepID=UPI0009DD094D|nr:SCO family protein [Methylotenera sp. N17]